MFHARPAVRSADLAGRGLSLIINRVYGQGAPRPLHPRGQSSRATWQVTAQRLAPLGVPVLDGGTRDCVVRHSRAVGLPGTLPDIEGLAIRLEGQDGGDLLLAGTGSGILTRYALVPRRRDGVCSTLLPMSTPTGAVLLRASPAPADNATWHLSWARPAGTWHTFGRLTLHADAGPPTPFDPINGLPTGLSQYDVVARLRNPAYIRAAMQRSSPAGSPHHAAELD